MGAFIDTSNKALDMVNNNPREAVYTTVQQDCIPGTVSGAGPHGSVRCLAFITSVVGAIIERKNLESLGSWLGIFFTSIGTMLKR